MVESFFDSKYHNSWYLLLPYDLGVRYFAHSEETAKSSEYL